MATTLSHFTSIKIPKNSRSRVVFPGAHWLPSQGTLGYVRSKFAKPKWRVTEQDSSQPFQPFRDYPEQVTTPLQDIINPIDSDYFIHSIRNVINEYPYQLRLDEKWYTPIHHPRVPGHFPCLTVSDDGIEIIAVAEAETRERVNAIVCGLPLVISGENGARPVAVSREFCISNSSDCAHSYPTDPKRFGPAGSWQAISDEWFRLFVDRGAAIGHTEESERTQILDSIAMKFDNWLTDPIKGNALTHGILADFGDDNITSLVMTGTPWMIGRRLVADGARQAFITDNSGSSAPHFASEKSGTLTPLAACPNWRDRGTAFIVIDSPFPCPSSHISI